MRRLISVRSLVGTIILLACLLTLTGMKQAGEELLVLHVNDFGATPASDNVYDALRSAVAAALDAGEPVEIRFEKDAVYRISPTGNPSMSTFALSINGADHLVINGQGSTLLITHPEVGGICTDNSSDIVIRDLSIDYDPLPYAPGTISEVNLTENWFELKVDSGFLEPDQPCFDRAMSKWGLTIRDEEDGGRRYGPIAIFASGWEKTGERLWRFHVPDEGGGYNNPLVSSGLKPGESYIHMARNYAMAVAARKCDHLLWENITVYASPGLAFYPHITSHHTIRNCHVKVKEGRFFSTNADGIHMRGSRGHVLIDGCSFQGMADDGINVHSSAISITGQPSLDKILVSKHTYSVSPGDTLVLVYSEKAEVGTTMKVLEVQEEGWTWLLTLDRELPPLTTGEGFSTSDNLYNLSEAANPFVIRNCHFGDYRGRGILVSAHGGLIENNLFDLREGWSVIFNYESTRWAEGPIAHDVTVRNNKFNANGGYAPAILSVLYGRDGTTDVLTTSPVRSFRNLCIEGNRFSEYGRPAIDLGNARDVLIRDNRIQCTDTVYRPRDSYASVMLKNCENVAIDSLWVTDKDIKHYAAVDIDTDCSPGNTISIKNLEMDGHPSSQEVMDHRLPPYHYGDMVRWRVAELTFCSDLGYTDCLNDVDLDVLFTHSNGTSLKVPAFWRGTNHWMVRFTPTLSGEWTFETICSDKSNKGLHEQAGSLNCKEYQGDLAIYQHGFVKTDPGKRYFTYADGTPFFYLGDTHWNIPVNSLENFKTIIDKRIEQGFTVIQSEPLDAGYDLTNGFTSSDLYYFAKLDKRFQYVADQGLVHANAQLVFVSELGWNRDKYPDEYLEKLCRYWVARYSAYPVMWTTAQESDNDYYYDKGTQDYFDADNNPWRQVAGYIHQYDPYNHPQTAHMEGAIWTIASQSSFRELPGHSWFAAQWKPKKNGQLNFSIPEDFWYNGQGKPTVNYEGHYDHLATKEFGARMQGWTAFLNGMCGHGYGAIDIWLYNSNYQMDGPTITDGDTVTIKDKQTKWDVSLEFPSACQMGHMHSFFDSIPWWELIPRFDDPDWFSNDSSWYSLASMDNDLYVVYFYNKTGRNTGTLKNLDDHHTYRAQWYNPREGLYLPISSSVISTGGNWVIPEKPDSLDWVLLLTNDGERLMDKIQGRWRLEANSLDESGANHGSLPGDAAFSVTETREGQYSLVLDGADDRLVIPDHPMFDELDSVCIAFWLQCDHLPSDSMIIMEKSKAFRLTQDSSGKLNFAIATENNPWNSEGTGVQGSLPLEAGTWHHVAVGYDGVASYIYLDGKLQVTTEETLSGKVLTNTEDLQIGGSTEEGWEHFKGVVDDLMFFREMPGPDEIRGLYSHYLPTARLRGPGSMADFDGDGVELVKLDGTASRDADGTIVSYEWQDDEQSVGVGEILYRDFTLGQHLLILTITDNNGIPSTDSLHMEITGADFSRWKLEENGMDSVGSNHGDLIGDPGFVTEEVMEGSYALSFDGVDDHVSINDHPSLGEMEQFSFAFWMKPEELPPGTSMILGKEKAYSVLYNSSGACSWVIATENNPWYSEGTFISSDRKLGRDVWNHVVAGYDGSSTYLYINGRLETKTNKPLSGQIINNDQPLTFAKGNDFNLGYFSGVIDDVRYFKYMLSDSSVYRLYRLYPMVDTSTQPGDTITSRTEINDLLNRVVLYPNPADEKVYIKNLPPHSTVFIYSLQGEQVGSFVSRTPYLKLDVSPYPSGLYILKVTHNDLLVVKKLIISP